MWIVLLQAWNNVPCSLISLTIILCCLCRIFIFATVNVNFDPWEEISILSLSYYCHRCYKFEVQYQLLTIGGNYFSNLCHRREENINFAIEFSLLKICVIFFFSGTNIIDIMKKIDQSVWSSLIQLSYLKFVKLNNMIRL